jgi:hypothetical protein
MIPFNKYFPDSAKFYIDPFILDRINIPEEFILIDSDTGNILDEFKKNSISIPYKNHKIYLAKEIKIIPGRKPYEKVMFYFPAKISPETYFYGITKEMIFEVLNYLKSLYYIDFEDINKVFQNIEVKDCDIKNDRQFQWSDKEKLINYNKSLKDRFNGDDSQFKIFNSKKDGLGIQTYSRNYTTLSKPFLKFYNKSDEAISSKNKETLFNLLPLEVQKILTDYLVYRYEFTIKTSDFFKHFNISNKISDILLITQDEWIIIGKYYLIKNFCQELKEPIDRSTLSPHEQIMSIMIYELIQRGNMTINQIRLIFESTNNRMQKKRNIETFERCYYFASVPNKETNKLLAIYNQIKELDIIFGF